MSIDPQTIVPTIVDVGLAAVFRARGDGIQLAISHMAVGRGLPDGTGYKGYRPTRTMTALARQDARVPLFSGEVLPGFGFRTLARLPPTSDNSSQEVREIAWFLETGEMLCLWSEVAPAPLAARTPRAGFDISFDLYLQQLPLEALTITVMQPDIPDLTGAIAEGIALDARVLRLNTEALQRQIRTLFSVA